MVLWPPDDRFDLGDVTALDAHHDQRAAAPDAFGFDTRIVFSDAGLG